MTSASTSGRRVEREDVLLWLFVLTPIVAWFAAQQLSFLAIRSLCASGHRWVLYLVMVPALAAAAACGVASWAKWQRFASKKSADLTATYRRFMALGGVLMSTLCSVAILSLMIPAAIHRLCD